MRRPRSTRGYNFFVIRLPDHHMSSRHWLGVAMLAACCSVFARQPQPRLPPAPIAQQLLVEVVQGDDEMGFIVPQTAMAVGMQLGLVGAVVGGIVQDRREALAETRMAPLREMLVDYGFYERFERMVASRIASEGISPHPQFDVRNAGWQEGGEAEPEAFVLVPRYSMDSDFGQMNVTMTAQWIKRVLKPGGKSELEILFIRNYAYSFPMRAGTVSERATRWGGLGRERMRGLMDEALDQMVTMLVYDFSNEGRGNWQAQVGRKEVSRLGDFGVAGRSIRQGPNWIWVLAGKEWPMLHGYHPIIDSTQTADAIDGGNRIGIQ